MAETKPPSFLSLLESGEYSDFTIECQNVAFKVHRAIICPQSTMLQTADSGGFKEAIEGRINLTDEDPAILAHILHFLYSSDYDASHMPTFAENIPVCEKIDAFGPDKELAVHVLIYAAADLLDIQALKVLASARFTMQCRRYCNEPRGAPILDLMYKSTCSNDCLLRLPITRMCLSEYQKVIKCDEIGAVIKEHEENVWKVTIPLLSVAAAKHSAATEVAHEAAIEEVTHSVVRQVSMYNVCSTHRRHGTALRGLWVLDEQGKVTIGCGSCHPVDA